MDYIREFDIRLQKEMYYAGETVYGVVILDTVENFKLRGLIQLLTPSSLAFRWLARNVATVSTWQQPLEKLTL